MNNDFARLGLPDSLVRALAKRGINTPFPVQAATIPDGLAGRDVSGKAPTGSGKTLAFGLPLLVNVAKAQKLRPTALILAPTRELAEQIKQELSPLGQTVGRHVFAVYGGVAYGPQKSALRRGADVLVATPGRLEDLIEQGAVDLRDVHIAVVDEADRMADMGFLPAVRRILDQTARRRQTLLFSATLDGDIAVLSRDYQHRPVRHEADSVVPVTTDAEHHFWLIHHDDRVTHAAEAIRSAARSIVFTRTRRGADRLAKQLDKLGLDAVAMHGGLSQNQRRRALRAFSSGRRRALIATDVAARGIHVDAVDSVIHFDPPADHKDYLHRSGRTARAGASGTVVSLVSHNQRRAARRMQRALDLDVPIGEPRIDDLHGAEAGAGRQAGENGHGARRHETKPAASRKTRQPAQRHGQRQEERPREARNGKRNGKGGESVYVANLPWATTADDLRSLFGRHGEVLDATIMTSRHTGRSRGFGFVEIASHDAASAVKALNGSTLGGRDLTVRPARPSRNRG